MLTFPPDITFAIQIASFFILWLGLKRLLFDPVLHVLETREARTAGLGREAAALRVAAERAATEYDRRMHEIRQELAVAAERERSATQTEERQLITAAREQATTDILQLRDRLSQAAEAARTALASEARDLSARMLERVSGRKLA